MRAVQDIDIDQDQINEDLERDELCHLEYCEQYFQSLTLFNHDRQPLWFRHGAR